MPCWLCRLRILTFKNLTSLQLIHQINKYKHILKAIFIPSLKNQFEKKKKTSVKCGDEFIVAVILLKFFFILPS